MGVVLLKGSGAAAKRNPLHDCCISMTAAILYDTVAHGSHGSRIKPHHQEWEMPKPRNRHLFC